MAATYRKLSRVRKPRVHITYDVETGTGQGLKKELPFIVGVIGDLSGDSPEPLKPLSERKFVQVNRDNFDEVLARIQPGLSFKVKNTLKDDGSDLAVKLNFNQLEDFEPASIVEQFEPLRRLLEARNKLLDLQVKVDRSEKLEDTIEELLKQSGKVERLAQELEAGAAATDPAGGEGVDTTEN